MSVQSEINRLKQAVSNAFIAVGNKGGTVPASKVSGNLASAIDSIKTGLELNFDVVCNPQPSSPKENTIWVNADSISHYYFSATQPENMVDYDVWFPVGTSSKAEFNALENNGIMVYPQSAKQMVSGNLNDVAAKIYRNSEWVSWVSDNVLYENGDENESVTGGWSISGWTSSGTTIAEATKNSDHILLGKTTAYTKATDSAIATKKPISIKSTHKNLWIEYTPLAIQDNSCGEVYLSKGKVLWENNVGLKRFTGTVNQKTTDKISLSTISGSYYVVFGSWLDSSIIRCMKIHRVWLE